MREEDDVMWDGMLAALLGELDCVDAHETCLGTITTMMEEATIIR